MGSKEEREAITEFITALFSWQEINFPLPFCISNIFTKKTKQKPSKNLKASKLRTQYLHEKTKSQVELRRDLGFK